MPKTIMSNDFLAQAISDLEWIISSPERWEMFETEMGKDGMAMMRKAFGVPAPDPEPTPAIDQVLNDAVKHGLATPPTRMEVDVLLEATAKQSFTSIGDKSLILLMRNYLAHLAPKP